tara:strand:+ start:341 stop:712 length:372 start_codon:yes stop_codon:yes gene_type:complete
MDQLNDFTKIIHNQYKTTGITKDSIYDEIQKKEKNMKEIIDRVINYEKDKEKDKDFINTRFSDIMLNIFRVLNDILDDFTKINKLTLKKFKKVINKEKRIIYIGIFMIVCAIFLALIEISDSV